MNLERIFDQIESIEFAANVHVAGSRNSFMATIITDRRTVDLFKAIEEDESICVVQIANRISSLCELEMPAQYLHTFDVALAVYLRVLDVTKQELAEAVAPYMADLPNLWWGKSLAYSLLNKDRLRTH